MIIPALKILIADDEAPARNRMRDLLGDIENIEIVAEAKNGKQAIDLAETTKPDVMLLDIRMPVMDGIEAAQHAQKLAHKPHIIFTTAFDAYAIKAFDLSAVDYLLKPIRLERLQAAINKAHALQRTNILASGHEALKAIQTPRQKARSHLSIHERGRVLLVPVETIIYLRAELKYITVRTAEREYLIEESLTHLEVEFGERFIRLHRNCIVAPQFIVGYEKRQNDDNEQQWVALLNNIPETIAISRRQQHLVKQS
jgi:two-component system, LytTR family, response regulator AlgR